MKLNKYIQQLLSEHDMVIVPGFGAFIQEYQAAELSENSDEILPPTKKLTFNPQIKNNDGLLVGFVASNSRGSYFEALQRIEKERDNWLYELDKGQKVVVPKIGTFYYNEQNEISFYSEVERDHSLESFGLEATSLSELIEETEAVQAEETTIETSGTETPNDEPVEPTPEKSPEAEPTTVDPIPETEPKMKEEEAATEEPELVEETSSPITIPVSEEKEEKKKKAGWWWLLIILIPLIGVGIYIIQKDRNAAEPPVADTQTSKAQTTESEPVAFLDTMAIDSLSAAQTDTATMGEVTQLPSMEPVEEVGPKYYLIGGSFKSEENAETFLQQLKEQGFDPFHLGKYGSYYIVGIGTYPSEEQALKARDEFLEKSLGSGIWVLKR